MEPPSTPSMTPSMRKMRAISHLLDPMARRNAISAVRDCTDRYIAVAAEREASTSRIPESTPTYRPRSEAIDARRLCRSEGVSTLIWLGSAGLSVSGIALATALP